MEICRSLGLHDLEARLLSGEIISDEDFARITKVDYKTGTDEIGELTNMIYNPGADEVEELTDQVYKIAVEEIEKSMN
jgi:hypothetical protein